MRWTGVYTDTSAKLLAVHINYSPIAFDKRVLFGFNTPCHCLVGVCVCCIVCMCDCVMVIHEPQKAAYSHAQVSDLANPKSYSLIEGNQTIVKEPVT